MKRGIIPTMLLGALWLLVSVGGSQAQNTADLSVSDLLQKASTTYAAGDYASAVSLYEALVQDQVHDGQVYFNLGNAYYAMGDLGRALLNYRRAQEFIPRDDDVNLNIARVRNDRLDVEGDDTGILNTLASPTIGLVTLKELGWLTFGLWAACFALIFLRISRPRWREMLRIPLLVAAVILLTVAVLFGSRLYTTVAQPAAVVIEPTVQVMSGPGDSYLKHFIIHSGAEIRVLETRNDWIRFTLPDGRQGWIPAVASGKVIDDMG